MVYGDDIIVFSDALDGINWATAQLIFLFELTDSGPLQYYLGVSFQCMGNNMLLSDRGYVRIILSQFGMESAKLRRLLCWKMLTIF